LPLLVIDNPAPWGTEQLKLAAVLDKLVSGLADHLTFLGDCRWPTTTGSLGPCGCT